MIGVCKNFSLMLGRNFYLLPILTTGCRLESKFVYMVGIQQDRHIYF